MVKRLFQFLMKLYPKDFLEDHGHEMEQVFRLQAEEGRVIRWRALGAMFRSAPREHWDAFRQDSRVAFRASPS